MSTKPLAPNGMLSREVYLGLLGGGGWGGGGLIKTKAWTLELSLGGRAQGTNQVKDSVRRGYSYIWRAGE
jgi:hypothetical protein